MGFHRRSPLCTYVTKLYSQKVEITNVSLVTRDRGVVVAIWEDISIPNRSTRNTLELLENGKLGPILHGDTTTYPTSSSQHPARISRSQYTHTCTPTHSPTFNYISTSNAELLHPIDDGITLRKINLSRWTKGQDTESQTPSSRDQKRKFIEGVRIERPSP